MKLSNIKSYFSAIPNKIKEIPKKLSKKFVGAKEILTQGNGKVSASMCIMGLGQLLYKQWAKGIMFLFIQIMFIVYMVLMGAMDLFGFFSLGTKESNAWYGIEGWHMPCCHAHYGNSFHINHYFIYYYLYSKYQGCLSYTKCSRYT